jgi:hypothetical protein
MKTNTLTVYCSLLAGLLAVPMSSPAQSYQLLVQDSPADTGAEPDTAIDPAVNPNGEMWVSQDIWVTQNPMPGYTPYPFPTASPPLWLTSNPNQNPQYRNPLSSRPNYIYVRIRNISPSFISDGSDEVHVYWAKASTGLSWPNQWVDYLDTTCGSSALYGIEITKPRRNIADPSVPISEVTKYLGAINSIAQNASLQFPDGVQYWYKQNAEHYFVAEKYLNGPTLPSSGGASPVFSAHGSDGFWPWHREFMSRYETLLRQADPTVTLFYWDWTTNPRSWPASVEAAVTAASPAGIGGFNGQIASAFTSSADVTSALSPLAPLPYPAVLASQVVNRFTAVPPEASIERTADSTIIGKNSFTEARAWGEGSATDATAGNYDDAHNYSHPYIGGLTTGSFGQTIDGNMSALPWAAQDPFFFLLHANVDRLWSMWQRNPFIPLGQVLGRRYDPSATGGNSLAYAGSMNYMNQPMAPWNGLTYNGTVPNPPNDPEVVESPLAPWRGLSKDQTTMKEANDNSIVFPAAYDTSPVTFPNVRPGYSVVVEIPWYPPNPDDYSCFGTDSGHVCLLVRITNPNFPNDGIDVLETADLYANVKNNSRIAWRNETVLDGSTGPGGSQMNDAVLARCLSPGSPVQLNLSLPSVNNRTLADFGAVSLDLGPTLFNRWVANGGVSQGFATNGGTTLQLLATNGFVGNIPMTSNELEQVKVELVLNHGYANPQGQVYAASLTQYGGGVTSNQNEPVGGQLFTFNFNQLDLVPKGSTWRYVDTGQSPGSNWNQVGFDDSQWATGAAKLGYGLGDESTVLSSGPIDASYTTTWFRYDFAVNDTSFFTNLWLQLKAYDGAIVYLNGVEIARRGMPGGAVFPTTPAVAPVTGLAAETFYPFDVSSFLPLLQGTNVLAVEVHVADTNNSAELGLDLELSGNVFNPSFPPQAALTASVSNNTPNNGLYLYGQPIQLTADTVATARPLQSVSYYSDGSLLGTVTNAPFNFLWNGAPIGTHQITLQPRDTAGASSESFTTLDVSTNVPPAVFLNSPSVGSVFAANSPVTMTATAQEAGGNIQKVDFYYARHGIAFDVPEVLAGTAVAPPYSIRFNGLAPGGYMVTAVATDTYGVTSYSVPAHIVVVANPTLTVSNVPPYVMLTWTPTNAVLQQSLSVTGPWQSMTNISTPYGFIPNPAVPGLFFRVALPLDGDAICSPQ